MRIWVVAVVILAGCTAAPPMGRPAASCPEEAPDVPTLSFLPGHDDTPDALAGRLVGMLGFNGDDGPGKYETMTGGWRWEDVAEGRIAHAYGWGRHTEHLTVHFFDGPEGDAPEILAHLMPALGINTDIRSFHGGYVETETSIPGMGRLSVSRHHSSLSIDWVPFFIPVATLDNSTLGAVALHAARCEAVVSGAVGLVGSLEVDRIYNITVQHGRMVKGHVFATESPCDERVSVLVDVDAVTGELLAATLSRGCTTTGIVPATTR